MKERMKGIAPTMLWLSAYKKPITLYEANKKIYPPHDKRFHPTSSHGYTIINDLIEKGHVIKMSHTETLTSKSYIRSTCKPMLQIINKRLESKRKFLTNYESEILSLFL